MKPRLVFSRPPEPAHGLYLGLRDMRAELLQQTQVLRALADECERVAASLPADKPTGDAA